MSQVEDIVLVIPVEDYERIVKLIETKNRALVEHSSRRIKFSEFIIKKDSHKLDIISKIYENLGKDISDLVLSAETRVKELEKKHEKKSKKEEKD